MRAKIGLAGIALFALSAGIARAEPVTLRVAWVAPLSDLASIWLEKKDLALNYGKSYVFEPVRYRGTPPMITAIANNELEIGALAYSTLPIAIENAGMDDIRVIADDFLDGVEGYYSNEFDVLADGPIKTIEDLKGKVVATNSAGSAVDVAILALPIRGHEFDTFALLTERLFAALPRNHSLVGRKTLALKDLRKEPFLLLRDGHCFRDTAVAACDRARLNPQIIFESGQFSSILSMVGTGMGVSIVPEMAIEKDSRCRYVRIADDEATRTIGAW